MKRFLIFFLFFIGFTSLVLAQKNSKDTVQTEKTKYPTFLKMNLHYPELAKKNKIEGTVIIKYDIDSKCSIMNRRIEKKLGWGCEEEALRVLDQYEVQLKGNNSNGCDIKKDLVFPVKFHLQ